MANKRKQQSSDENKTAKKTKNSNEKETQLNQMYGMNVYSHIKKFYEFCKVHNPDSPKDALSCLNLQLVGPFKPLMSASIAKEQLQKPASYHHIRWRFYYDPPECLTLLMGSEDHFMLMTDDPRDTTESIIVSGNEKSCKLKMVSDNLFSCVNKIVLDELKSSNTKVAEVKKLKNALIKFCDEHDIDLTNDGVTRQRKNKWQVKLAHGAGMVVPVQEDETGYRRVFTQSEITRNMRSIVTADNDEIRIKKFEPISEILNHLQYADDELDFGARLEFGLSLFLNGSFYFHKMAKSSLSLAYNLLNRNLYSEIIQAHIDDRNNKKLPRV